MLFDFEIKYRAGKTNQAADALSQRPENPDSLSESSDDMEEWDTISYEMVCQILDHHLNSQLNCPIMSNMKCKITLWRLMKQINWRVLN